MLRIYRDTSEVEQPNHSSCSFPAEPWEKSLFFALNNHQNQTFFLLAPLPAAWLARIPWMGPTWEVGGTLATPLLLTEEGVEGLRHRFSDFSLRGDGGKHEETETGYSTTTNKSVSE